MQTIKHYLSVMVLFLISTQVNAQVGIGTEAPQSILHVVGDETLTGEFKVGGDDSTEGDPGIEGQVLKSNGSGKAPSWSDLEKMKGVSSIIFYQESASAYTFSGTGGSFVDVPGMVYSFTSPATGYLLIQASLFSAIDNPSANAINNVQYQLVVNGVVITTCMGSPMGMTGAGYNPESTTILTRFGVSVNQAYDIRIQANQAYVMGGANASVGKVVWGATSTMTGTLITTE